MVETIAPVVHGGRNRSYWTAVVLHTGAATLTAAVFGAALGAIGGLFDAPWGRVGIGLLAGVSLLYAARETFRLPLPVFDRHRQVPEWWRTFYSPNVAALLYGAGLGIGFATFLTFGTFVAVAVGALFSGDAVTGAVIVGPFGLARSVAVVAANYGRNDFMDTLERLNAGPGPRLVNALVLAATAAVALLTLP